MDIVAKVKLLAVKEATYTIYVFRDLEKHEFLMCTRLPNWQGSSLSIGDTGYVSYKVIQGGEPYYNPETEKMSAYRYSGVYFNNFVREADNIKQEEIIL